MTSPDRGLGQVIDTRKVSGVLPGQVRSITTEFPLFCPTHTPDAEMISALPWAPKPPRCERLDTRRVQSRARAQGEQTIGGKRFLLVDQSANQRAGSKVSKIWDCGKEPRHFPFASIGPPSSDLQTPSLVWQESSLDVAAQLEVPHHILDILAIDEGRFWVKHILVGARSSGRQKTQSG